VDTVKRVTVSWGYMHQNVTDHDTVEEALKTVTWLLARGIQATIVVNKIDKTEGDTEHD